MLSVAGLEPTVLVSGLSLAAVAVAVVVWRRRRGAAPGASATPRLQDMKSREFEALVRESFQRQGYTSIAAPPGVAEGGEIVLRRERETMLVLCRHWREPKVGADAVRAFQRTLAQRGAGSGFILSTGRFAREAVAVAAAGNVRLLDGPALQDLLGKSGRR